MIVVADATPLIHLHRVGRIDLLRAVFSEIVVPPVVAREIAAGPVLDAMIVGRWRLADDVRHEILRLAGES